MVILTVNFSFGFLNTSLSRIGRKITLSRPAVVGSGGDAVSAVLASIVIDCSELQLDVPTASS